MPAGDGSGPFGTGPNGRGFGPCGQGQGGLAGGGFRRGGWFNRGWGNRSCGNRGVFPVSLSPEVEKASLEREKTWLEAQLAAVTQRLLGGAPGRQG